MAEIVDTTGLAADTVGDVAGLAVMILSVILHMLLVIQLEMLQD